MILQQPKRKKAKPVKKTTVNANQSGSQAPSHALSNCPLQVVPRKSNGHDGSTRHKLQLPLEPAPPQSPLRVPLSSWAGPPGGPMPAPCFSPPLPVPCPVEKHGVDKIPHLLNQEPALYDLIYSKFDAVMTSIDDESFSGDRRELGR